MPLDLTGEDERDDDRRVRGDDDEKPKRGRPPKTRVQSELRGQIGEQLNELAEWIGKKDPELGEILRDDAPKIAKFLTARAGKHARLAKVLAIVFAPDGPLGGLRAFGRFGRALGERIGARRERNLVHVDEEGFIVDPETGLRILDETTGQPIRHEA